MNELQGGWMAGWWIAGITGHWDDRIFGLGVCGMTGIGMTCMWDDRM